MSSSKATGTKCLNDLRVPIAARLYACWSVECDYMKDCVEYFARCTPNSEDIFLHGMCVMKDHFPRLRATDDDALWIAKTERQEAESFDFRFLIRVLKELPFNSPIARTYAMMIGHKICTLDQQADRNLTEFNVLFLFCMAFYLTWPNRPNQGSSRYETSNLDSESPILKALLLTKGNAVITYAPKTSAKNCECGGRNPNCLVGKSTKNEKPSTSVETPELTITLVSKPAPSKLQI